MKPEGACCGAGGVGARRAQDCGRRWWRKRPPGLCVASRCLSVLVPISLLVQGGTAFQAPRSVGIFQQQPANWLPPSSSEPSARSGSGQSTRLAPVLSIASEGLSLGLGDSWRFHPGWDSEANDGFNKPWRPGAPAGAPVAVAEAALRPSSGRAGKVQQEQSAPILREPWKAGREESQVMQALILRSQSDPMEMLRILFSKPQSCNHVNVCTVLHRCARMGDALPDEARERVRAELLPVVRDVLPDCRGRHLCNVAWSLAKMRLAEEEEMVDMIVAELTEPGVLESCNGGELAMAVWAVVALGYASEYAGFLMAAAEPITAKAGELKPKEIGLITWAYAAALTHVWGDEVDDPTTEMRWLAAPVQALMERTLRCEDQLKPKDIAMVAWAFGRLVKVDWNGLGPHVDMLCATLASSALKCIKQFSAQDLAELAVGVVHMQYDNANLMQLIAFQATQKLRQFSHRELSNLIWAFGKVFRRPRRFVLAVVEEARGRLPHFTKQELANLAWALTVLEVYDKALLSEVFVVMQRKREALDESDLNQLYQVYSLLKLQAPDAVTGVGPRLLKQMETAWARSKEREKRLTDRQAAVSRILQTLNIDHVLEAEHDIDILLREQAIAMEVDGPAHFLRNTGHPMGHTVMKRRILQRLGYSVVSIPHFEWDRIPHWSSMELKRYIQRKCTIAEVLHFSKNDFSSLKTFPPRGKKNRFD